MEKKIFALLLFTAAIGEAAGCFFEIYMEGEEKFLLMEQLDLYFASGSANQAFLPLFRQNFRSSLISLLLCAIPLIFPSLFLLPFFMIFIRSLFFGVSAAMVLETLGITGLFQILVSLVPSALIHIPVLSFTASFAISRSGLKLPSLQKKRTAPQTPAEQYIFLYLTVLSILAAADILQVVLLKTVL